MSFVKADVEMKNMYNKIINEQKKFGKYYKALFHLHTIASYDYKFNNKEYKKCTDEEIYNYAINLIPKLKTFIYNPEENEKIKIYSSKKEFLMYMLIAKTLINNKIDLAVITDHNTIDGYDKLKNAVKLIFDSENILCTDIILGIEISCADKNHVVGIFDINNMSLKKKINNWINEFVMNQEGTYLTSLEVISQINNWGGIAYIAHFDTSNFFKDSTFLNNTYKKKLFSLDCLNVIGLSNIKNLHSTEERLKYYSHKEFCYILDNDSHCIEDVNKNIMWLKGTDKNYKMIESAIRDFQICIEYDEPKKPEKYIKGLAIRNTKNGFLIGKDDDVFCLSFSEYLNCLIGGRGTGKSSIINLLEYAIQQNIKNEHNLENILKYSSIWLLFQIEEKEYMIQIYNPRREYENESLSKLFGYYSRSLDYLAIKKYLLKKSLKLYEIKNDNNQLYKQSINDKERYLNNVFNTSYSINELVETANKEKINNYIFNTMFKNKILSSSNKLFCSKSLNGLKNNVLNLSAIKEKRKKEVEDVINSFNETQKGILKITYNQDDKNIDILNMEKLFSKKYNIYNDEYYHNKNITTSNIIFYLSELNSRFGIVKLIQLFIDKDINTLEKEVSINNYLEEKNKWLIDHDIEFVTKDNKEILIKSIIDDIINLGNIKDLNNSLNKYIEKIELFDIEFNINNKESNNRKKIYRNIKDLSLGQKVVAMLSFVLGYSDYSNDYSPLVIDQPEDNLDNQYIYKNLVEKLRETKSKRQVIIATHSSTIVTNAKAEQVVVLESDNEHGWIEAKGYPNDKKIKKQIINHLEGGIDSFRHKQFIYKEILDNNEY